MSDDRLISSHLQDLSDRWSSLNRLGVLSDNADKDVIKVRDYVDSLQNVLRSEDSEIHVKIDKALVVGNKIESLIQKLEYELAHLQEEHKNQKEELKQYIHEISEFKLALVSITHAYETTNARIQAVEDDRAKYVEMITSNHTSILVVKNIFKVTAFILGLLGAAFGVYEFFGK